jgi:dihydrofolate reductase
MLIGVMATDRNGVIGNNGKLPWRMRDDLRYFKALTDGHTIVMGSVTKASLPGPLPNRTEWVISRSKGDYDAQIQAVVEAAKQADIFVIGGGVVMRAFEPYLNMFYHTEILAEVDGDAHFTLSRPSDQCHLVKQLWQNDHNQYHANIYQHVWF